MTRIASSDTIDIESAVENRIGSPSAGNYAQFATDGELTLEGTARVIQMAWVPAQSIRAPGLKPATYVDHGVSGAWEFADNQEEIIVCNLAIPFDADMTEDLYI